LSRGANAPKPPAIPQFQAILPRLPVLAPTRRDATTDYYELTQQQARAEIVPGFRTTILGFNGQFPGPIIEAHRGRRVVLRMVNELPTADAAGAAYVCGGGSVPLSGQLAALAPGARAAATVVHLHGGVTPPDSDGFPTDLIPPGSAREYVYPNEQRAATLWYHDHALDTTAHHNYLGLVGFYLVHDEVEEGLPLPQGEFDVPILLRDASFDADGQLANIAKDQFFADGDVTLVNGVPWPRFEVAARKYRFRILNASNSRPYYLKFADGRPLVQIATDGGLLAAPVAVPSIVLGPAERAEIVVDFAAYPPGSQVVLQNLGKDPPMDAVMRFDVVSAAKDDSALPSRLAEVERLQPSQATTERTFVFSPTLSLSHAPYYWTINGQAFDPSRVDATPRLGEVEVWRFVNHKLAGIHGMPHPVHVHLVTFQVLDRNGGAPPAAYEAGWKDTVYVPEGEEARVIMRFDGYRGRYLLHCHNLQHADCAMMTTFQVV
jgi:spore coat protein A, manganese oxidase